VLERLLDVLREKGCHDSGEEGGGGTPGVLAGKQQASPSSEREPCEDRKIVGRCDTEEEVDRHGQQHVGRRVGMESQGRALGVKDHVRGVGRVSSEESLLPPPQVPVVLPEIVGAQGDVGAEAAEQWPRHHRGHQQIQPEGRQVLSSGRWHQLSR
jgi:hypothetical protein